MAELAHFIRHTHQDLADTISFAQEVMQSLDVSGDGLMSRYVGAVHTGHDAEHGGR